MISSGSQGSGSVMPGGIIRVTAPPPSGKEPMGNPPPGVPEEPEDLDGGRAVVPPRWVPLTTSVICALALVDSAYLTYTHYSATSPLACPTHGFIDCGLVTTSSYSHPFGIPVAVAGLAWSIVMLGLCSPWAWRVRRPPWVPWVSRARLAGSVAGVAMVLWLLWVELFKLHHLCEYCTVVHVLSIALFFVIVFGMALAEPAEPGEAGT